MYEFSKASLDAGTRAAAAAATGSVGCRAGAATGAISRNIYRRIQCPSHGANNRAHGARQTAVIVIHIFGPTMPDDHINVANANI